MCKLTFLEPNHLLASAVRALWYLGQLVLVNCLPLPRSLLDCTRDTPYLKNNWLSKLYIYIHTHTYASLINAPVFICPHL